MKIATATQSNRDLLLRGVQGVHSPFDGGFGGIPRSWGIQGVEKGLMNDLSNRRKERNKPRRITYSGQ
jgi:hypothetical protein